ncbi:MAG: phenylalanine--tRNA ligase subunit alpha [Synergistaceae bacterium]|nr:phenylalanine--tRNA ligase subunit alpha [Synergistaceae bacterium]
MLTQVEKLREYFISRIDSAESGEELQSLKVNSLGKKGEVTALLKTLGSMPPDERKAAGESVNSLRNELEEKFEVRAQQLRDKQNSMAEQRDTLDVSLPARGRGAGVFHPVVETLHEIVDIMIGVGFSVALGPEVEEDFYNFEALNIPKSHPARDMQDTFYFPATDEHPEARVLRTHTSPVQVRSMLKYGAPLRVVCPGKVYRRDNDPTHSPMFNQLEGLLVDEDVAFADMKGCLQVLMNEFFGKTLRNRYRASYFPFTEPSMELDVECFECSGRNPACRICKGSGWLEVSGMGMVHPYVLRSGGIDPSKYNGFAWGMGLDRMAMLKYGISDLRLMFDGSLQNAKGGE